MRTTHSGLGLDSQPADPDGDFNVVSQTTTSALSNSNGVNATFSRRFAHGFSFLANYTWSHTLDEVSNGGAFVYGGDSFLSQFNPAGLRANNYGNADYDIRHNFNSTVLWQPGYKPSSKVLGGVVGGWSFSATVFARTALPYTILDTNSLFGSCATFAGLCFVPGQPIGAGAAPGQQSCVNGDSQCFNIASFVDAGSATFTGYPTYPTQRRNQYRGPQLLQCQLQCCKELPLYREDQVQRGCKLL